MIHILTIETNNTAYFEQFRKLAQKLGVTAIEKHEDVNQPLNQLDRFQKMEKLRKKLSNVKVDPNVDLSALANEVNL